MRYFVVRLKNLFPSSNISIVYDGYGVFLGAAQKGKLSLGDVGEETEMDASETDVLDRVRDFIACGWWSQISVLRRKEKGFDALFQQVIQGEDDQLDSFNRRRLSGDRTRAVSEPFLQCRIWCDRGNGPRQRRRIRRAEVISAYSSHSYWQHQRKVWLEGRIRNPNPGAAASSSSPLSLYTLAFLARSLTHPRPFRIKTQHLYHILTPPRLVPPLRD